MLESMLLQSEQDWNAQQYKKEITCSKRITLSITSRPSLSLWHNQICHWMNKPHPLQHFQKWRIYLTATMSICLIQILKILKLGKSGAPDGLSPERIVYGGDVLKIWLKIIASSHLKKFLSVWRKAWLFLSKKGKERILSYRGITLFCVVKGLRNHYFAAIVPSLGRARFPKSAANCLPKRYIQHWCHLCHTRDSH